VLSKSAQDSAKNSAAALKSGASDAAEPDGQKKKNKKNVLIIALCMNHSLLFFSLLNGLLNFLSLHFPLLLSLTLTLLPNKLKSIFL
jgi:hypothetical protein